MPRLPLTFAALLLFALFSAGVFLDRKASYSTASASTTSTNASSAMSATSATDATGATAATSATSDSSPNSSQATRVAIADDAFKPPRLTVAVGATVTWLNHDDDPHTITSVQPLFDSNGMAQGDSYSFTFRKPGTYAYYCKVHPFMKGTIVVTGAHS